MKISEPSEADDVQSASLPGSRNLRTAVLRAMSFFCATTKALFGALDHEIEQLVRLQRIAGEPMIEGILDRLLNDPLSLGGGKTVFGLALKFRFAHEHR